jgi:hypothetical protein
LGNPTREIDDNNEDTEDEDEHDIDFGGLQQIGEDQPTNPRKRKKRQSMSAQASRMNQLSIQKLQTSSQPTA